MLWITKAFLLQMLSSEMMNVSVCMSVHEHISKNVCQNFTKFLVYTVCGYGSLLLWQQHDMGHTLDFVDNVTSVHNWPSKGDIKEHVYSKWLTGAALDWWWSCCPRQPCTVGWITFQLPNQQHQRPESTGLNQRKSPCTLSLLCDPAIETWGKGHCTLCAGSPKIVPTSLCRL